MLRRVSVGVTGTPEIRSRCYSSKSHEGKSFHSSITQCTHDNKSNEAITPLQSNPSRRVESNRDMKSGQQQPLSNHRPCSYRSGRASMTSVQHRKAPEVQKENEESMLMTCFWEEEMVSVGRSEGMLPTVYVGWLSKFPSAVLV